METNSEPLSVPPPVSPEKPAQPSFSNKNKIIAAVLILVGIFILAGGYFALAYYQNIWPFANPAPSPVLTESPSYSPSPSETASNYPSTSESQTPSPSASPVTYPLDVKWNDKLIGDESSCLDVGCDYYSFYIAGDILNGELKGEHLYLKNETSMCEFFSHVVFKNDQAIAVENIKGISDLPKEINYSSSNYKLSQGNISSFFSEIGTSTKIFHNDVLGDAYKTEEGCIIFELPDHTALAYNFNFPFIGESGLLDLKFNDGQQNKEEYKYIRPSCCATCVNYEIISEETLQPQSRLQLAGKTASGEEFYEIKDQNDAYLKELYNNKYTVAYYSETGYQQMDKSKYTYEQFISYHPYLYWKDPLGDWMEFTNKRFDIMAEMCKPVIYFYPESSLDLTVKVAPNGGIKFSEPPYGGAWQVRVEPNGVITDLKTGLKYSSLLWEGWGLHYPEIIQGWVVAKAGVNNFLDEKLSYLGLNQKEIFDFEDYWLPKLSEKPYYAISFLSQSQFNELAALSISPVNPKTTIRVMMTAKGLDERLNLPEQKLIKAPERNGFTVVEWGGALFK